MSLLAASSLQADVGGWHLAPLAAQHLAANVAATVVGDQVFGDAYVVRDGSRLLSVLDVYVKSDRPNDVFASVYGVPSFKAAWTQVQGRPFVHAGNSSWNPRYLGSAGASWDSFVTAGMREQTVDEESGSTPIGLTADPGFSNFSSPNAASIVSNAANNGAGWYPVAGANPATNPYCVFGLYNGQSGRLNVAKNDGSSRLSVNGIASGASLDNMFMIGRFTIDITDDVGADNELSVKFCMTVVSDGVTRTGSTNAAFRVNQTLLFANCDRPNCWFWDSLQQAIDGTPAGETLLVPAGVYNEAIDFKGKAIHVLAVGPQATTILDGTGLSTSVVRAVSGEGPSTILEGFTIRNGPVGSLVGPFQVGGGMYVSESSPTLRGCRFANNLAGFGGGIYTRYSNLLIEDCIFEQNVAGVDGGGVQLFGGSPVVRNCTIANNRATNRGGAFHIVQHVSGGAATVDGCVISNNQAFSEGGGVSLFCLSGSPLKHALLDCEITSNASSGKGGGVFANVDSVNPLPNITLVANDICENISSVSTRGNVYALFEDGGNTICDCRGDVDDSLAVDSGDISILLVYFGRVTPASFLEIDQDMDGAISGGDLSRILVEFGGCPVQGSLPAPGSHGSESDSGVVHAQPSEYQDLGRMILGGLRSAVSPRGG